MQMISTGLKKLDDFFSGGISGGVLVDIFGANGTGKTQLLLQLSFKAISNGGTVLYVDTTGQFRPERILEIQNSDKSKINCLDKITISRTRNTFEQIKIIRNLDESNFSLVVIDNITDLFSYEYSKDNLISEKNLLFMKYMHELARYSLASQVPVIMTNMVRNIEDKEFENMQGAIDPFTHFKIHLFRNKSFFSGEIFSALGHQKFRYDICQSGLSDFSEDI